MKKGLLYAMIICMELYGCGQEKLSERVYNEGINLIPAPACIEQGEGAFVLNRSTDIYVSHDSLRTVASFYAQKMRTATGYELPLAGAEERDHTICLSIDPTIAGDEAYCLDVNPQKIDVRASSLRGLFYGMASLMQLLPAEIESG